MLFVKTGQTCSTSVFGVSCSSHAMHVSCYGGFRVVLFTKCKMVVHLLPPVSFCAQTLAYNAGMYSRAQAMRREGTAPASMGIADDLPNRVAYQQLHILAGMAGKVSSC